MKKLLLFLLVAGVYAAHQDYWNWKNSDLVFGFLPMGLAYHAGYTIVASITMALLVRFAWPAHLEKTGEAGGKPGESKVEGKDSHG